MTAAKSDAGADGVILHHTPAWWIAEFRGSIARLMRECCGTDTVPTGFNGHIPGPVVCTAIALLNPNAEVNLAEPAAEPARAAETPVADTALGLAAEVVGAHQRTVAADKTAAGRTVIDRAMKLKRTLGLMVACSYLKEQGWSFEAAHRALLQAAARR